MSVTEFERHQIFQWYEEAMGSERASIMMNLVPPVGWGDIATKRDLAMLSSTLHGEMAELRGEMAEIRGEMAELRAEVRGDIAELRGEMVGMRGELARSLITWLLASQATLVGLVLAAVRLG